MRGIKAALDYLKAFYPVTLHPDTLHKRAGIDTSCSSLSRRLRSEYKKKKVQRVFMLSNTGRKIAFYRWNMKYRRSTQWDF